MKTLATLPFIALFALSAFAQDLVVNVNLTNLAVSVEDETGRPVSNLTAGDFEIIEKGQPKEVRHFSFDAERVAIGLLVDRSASTEPVKKQLDTLLALIMEAAGPSDEAFLMTFAGTNKLHVGLTTDRKEILDGLRKARKGFGSRFYDAVIDSLQFLSWSRLDRKLLIVLSDGADHYSTHTFRQTLEAASLSGYEIYLVGCAGQDSRTSTEQGRQQIRSEFEQLASATGGTAFFPAGREEYSAIAARILQTSRYAYRLGFYSSAGFSDLSTVQVRLRDPRRGRFLLRTSWRPPQDF